MQRQTWNDDGRPEDAVQLISDAEDRLDNYMTFLTTAVNEIMKVRSCL